MPDRGADYAVIGTPNNRGGERALTEEEKQNLAEWDQQPGGAERARQDMWNQGQAAGTRTGPQVSRTQGDNDMARALDDRGNQQYLANYLGGVAAGTTATPAQRQLQEQTAQAQGYQQSAAASGRGFGAVAGAPRDATLASQNIGREGAQQLGVQRAQDMANARGLYGEAAQSLVGQDIDTRGFYQNRANQQAGLDDQQRAQNDAMTRFYLGQRFNIGQDQLNANIGYEKADAARVAGTAASDYADRQRALLIAQQYQAAAAKGAGDAVTATKDMASDPDNPWGL